MRLASFDQDFWELRSAEAAHEKNPSTFWIPTLSERRNLKRGQAARLILDIELEDEEGNVIIQGERMNVIVSEQYEGVYIGLLDSQPASVEPSESAYLRFGAEIPFLPEHIIDILNPPAEYADLQIGQEPERRWSRE